MKYLFILCSFFSCLAFGQEPLTLDQISNPREAREFAADHMWSEVVVISKEECKWLLNVEHEDNPNEPNIGDMAVVRNTSYKLIADTSMKVINCSVLDFDLETMSEEEADSLIQRYMIELSSHGRFDHLVSNHLSQEEQYRYNNFIQPTSVIMDYFGTTFVSRSKGEIFRWRHPQEPYMFLIQIMQDPIDIEGFIVLKSRVDQ